MYPKSYLSVVVSFFPAGTNTLVLVLQDMTEIRLWHYPTTHDLRPHEGELLCSYLDMAVFQTANVWSMSGQNTRILDLMDFLDPVYGHGISVRLTGLSPALQQSTEWSRPFCLPLCLLLLVCACLWDTGNIAVPWERLPSLEQQSLLRDRFLLLLFRTRPMLCVVPWQAWEHLRRMLQDCYTLIILLKFCTNLCLCSKILEVIPVLSVRWVFHCGPQCLCHLSENSVSNQ